MLTKMSPFQCCYLEARGEQVSMYQNYTGTYHVPLSTVGTYKVRKRIVKRPRE